MRRVLSLSFLAMLIGHHATARVAGNTYIDTRSGFSIAKPGDWEFVKEPKVYGTELKNSTLVPGQNEMLVSFSKTAGDAASGIRPSIGVKELKAVRPGSNLVNWLADEMNRQSAHDKYFVPGSSASTVTLDRQTGAQSSFVNSTIISGHQVRVYHALYVVPVGGKIYLINMNCNEDQANQYASVFANVAGSIVAHPQGDG